MAKTEIIWAPIPRSEKHIPAGKRTPVDGMHVDVLPLEVRAVSSDDAPVAVRFKGLSPQDGPLFWRTFEGAFWSPLELGHGPIKVEELTQALQTRIRDRLHTGSRGHLLGEEIYGHSVLSTKAEDLRTTSRKLVSDGRPAQTKLAAEFGQNLLIVDGLVHHRSRAPSYVLTDASISGARHMRLKAERPYFHKKLWDIDAPAPAWAVFLPDQEREARAMFEAMRRPGDAFAGADLGCLFVIDEAAFLSAAPSNEKRRAEAIFPPMLEALKPLAGYLDDEGLAAFMALRDLVAQMRGGDLPDRQDAQNLRRLLQSYGLAREMAVMPSAWERHKPVEEIRARFSVAYPVPSAPENDLEALEISQAHRAPTPFMRP